MTRPIFPLRRIRSFVCRNSRMTRGQVHAHETGWPQFGLSMQTGVLDQQQVFGRIAPLIVEIGFGMGHSLLALAKAHPDKNMIGIETHKPGVGALFQGIEQAQLTNIRVYQEDAVEILQRAIPDDCLDSIQIFFPDPWPKRRHHVRRLIQRDFIDKVADKLKIGGEIHLATDWEDYAIQMLHVLTQSNRLTNTTHAFAGRSCYRPVLTKFERRAKQEGRAIWELCFVKTSRVYDG